MRIFFLVSGILCVALAALGVLLPGLPATPFLLLASYFFARSSKKMHDWLINNKVFGPILTDFLEKKGIRLNIKIYSIVLMWAMIVISVLFLINSNSIKYLALAGAVIGTIAILRFKTIRS